MRAGAGKLGMMFTTEEVETRMSVVEVIRLLQISSTKKVKYFLSTYPNAKSLIAHFDKL